MRTSTADTPGFVRHQLSKVRSPPFLSSCDSGLLVTSSAAAAPLSMRAAFSRGIGALHV